jgi:selenocysteine lyase/cysteine desulfurase
LKTDLGLENQARAYKKHFYPSTGIYALSHSVGPLPKVAEEALKQHYLQPWAEHGGDAWPHWLQAIDDFCVKVGTLINASENEICPQTNLASGFSAYLTAIAKLDKNQHRRTILMHKDAFASMGFVVSGLTQSHGLKLALVDCDPNDLDAWDIAIQSHDVLACLFTHVHSNTSQKSKVKVLSHIAKKRGVYALVDVAQSAGVSIIDVQDWQVDALFGSCVKWLCGGPGAGYMYLQRDQIEALEPDIVGWFSHQNPFEFDILHYQASASAKRFWGGTPSVAPFVMASASISLMMTIGIDNIIAHNNALKTALIERLQAKSTVSILPALKDLEQQGGSLCVGATNMAEAEEKLKCANIRFDRRENIFRLSLHIMNDMEDIDAIAACF